MTQSWRRFLPTDRWIEPLLALVVAGGLIRAMWYVYENGYLPQPFFYDVGALWTDWFAPAVWARDIGTYDSWGSIYPPLTFVIFRLIGKPSCYVDPDVFSARDCDWIGVAVLHAMFVLNIFLISLTFLKIDRRTALPRSFALAAGLPMLSALERGNIFLLCFSCMILGYGPLVKSTRLRWVAIAMTVNFKVYLIGAIFPHLAKRRWRWIEGALLSSVALYLVTYAIMGRGTPMQVYQDIVSYSQGQASQILDVWSTITYKPLLAVINSDLPVTPLIGSRNVDILSIVLPLSMYFTQALIITAIVFIWLRPECVPTYRASCLGVLFVLITSETGNYGTVLFILFVFMEPWRGTGRRIAIVSCYVLCFPFDIVIDRLISRVGESYLTGRPIVQNIYLMVGFFIRPAFGLLISISMSWVTIREVWIDIRKQGWKERWRFRHDAPIMLGSGEARRPPWVATDR